ncbi:MAG: carbamoyltransferase [Planctomycetota bacterium]
MTEAGKPLGLPAFCLRQPCLGTLARWSDVTFILGLSAFYHDAAATLLRDGEIVFAASEERFSRLKHDARFPTQAIQAALDSFGITPSDLDYVGFYEKPLLKFDRLLETYLAHAPRGYRSFAKAMPEWLVKKLHLPRIIRSQLPGYQKRILFCEHHQSHAASAFFPSPFDEAAILVMDGVGEWASTSWGIGRKNEVELKQRVNFPHSIGLLYSAMTAFCGFKVNSGEYKLMGLAPFGTPRYEMDFWKHLVHQHRDGSFRLNTDFFTYPFRLEMTGKRLERLVGHRRRDPNEAIRQVDLDIAATTQAVTEKLILGVAAHVHQCTQQSHLCIAGGVGLNCVANGRLLREGPFDDIWIQPAAGDAGGSLGVATLIHHQLLNQERSTQAVDRLHGCLLGPAIGTPDDLQALRRMGAVGEQHDDSIALAQETATLLAKGQIVGVARGSMEFGPRALGNRSILADPRDPMMQTKLNQQIKRRESFRPFAPVVTQERAADYFDMPENLSSPYMLNTFFIRAEHRTPSSQSNEPCTILDQIQDRRSCLPAITHVDHSARVQTVNATQNRFLHATLEAFEQITGFPVLINTSFNRRGEPIVCTAADAYDCFLASNIDVLILGTTLYHQERQPAHLRATAVKETSSAFED